MFTSINAKRIHGIKNCSIHYKVIGSDPLDMIPTVLALLSGIPNLIYLYGEGWQQTSVAL